MITSEIQKYFKLEGRVTFEGVGQGGGIGDQV